MALTKTTIGLPKECVVEIDGVNKGTKPAGDYVVELSEGTHQLKITFASGYIFEKTLVVPKATADLVTETINSQGLKTPEQVQQDITNALASSQGYIKFKAYNEETDIITLSIDTSKIPVADGYILDGVVHTLGGDILFKVGEVSYIEVTSGGNLVDKLDLSTLVVVQQNVLNIKLGVEAWLPYITRYEPNFQDTDNEDYKYILGIDWKSYARERLGYTDTSEYRSCDGIVSPVWKADGVEVPADKLYKCKVYADGNFGFSKMSVNDVAEVHSNYSIRFYCDGFQEKVVDIPLGEIQQLIEKISINRHEDMPKIVEPFILEHKNFDTQQPSGVVVYLPNGKYTVDYYAGDTLPLYGSLGNALDTTNATDTFVDLPGHSGDLDSYSKHRIEIWTDIDGDIGTKTKIMEWKDYE